MTQPTPFEVVMRPSMDLSQSVKAFFQNYVRFSGRAGKSEFWYAFGLFWLLSTVLKQVSQYSDSSIFSMLSLVVMLATFLPMLSAQVRRLHDTNRSGWWVLLHLVLIIGSIILVIFNIGDSNPEGARFDAKDGSQPATGE